MSEQGHQYTDELRFLKESHRDMKNDIKALNESFNAFVKAQQEHNEAQNEHNRIQGAQSAEVRNLLAGSVYGEKGLVKKQEDLDDRVERLEILKNKALGYAMASGAFAGGVLGSGVNFLIG